MNRVRALAAVACAAALVAGCGGGSDGASAKPTSIEEALGLDQASMNAREAKVQEKVRQCMKAQGFDYVPVDPSQGGLVVRFGGPGGSGDAKTRKTKGYGITTGFMSKPVSSSAGNDPNQRIREGLSEADQAAYDRALFGASVDVAVSPGGGRRVARHVESGKGSATASSLDDGCFGTAQQEVPGGAEQLGTSLKDLQQRIDGDPRLVSANRRWAGCMAASGYGQFEEPNEIIKYLFGKLQTVSGTPPPEGDGDVTFAIGGDDVDQAALAELQREELSLAKADDACATKTGRAKVEREVRDEAEAQFLEDHPDLTAGS